MKSARLLLSAVLAGGAVALPATTRAADPIQGIPPPPAQQSDRLSAAVEAIRQAPDPSSAIQAYADSQAVERNDLAAVQAYVQKMVELGLPEMADTQAQDLLRRNPNDGLAWAVAAYMSAKQDNTALALSDIALGIKYAPDNIFVQRTAGQLIAWYDTRADQSKIPDDIKASVQKMRQQLANNPAYTEAYASAVSAYKQMAQGSTTQPSAQPPVPGGSAPGPSGAAQPQPQPSFNYEPAPGGSSDVYPPSDYFSYYTPYPNPYFYPLAYPAYSYWWPSPSWGGAWWWPTFTCGGIFNSGFFFGFNFAFFNGHHHDFDDCNFFVHHGNFHHGNFNHGNFHHGNFAHGNFHGVHGNNVAFLHGSHGTVVTNHNQTAVVHNGNVTVHNAHNNTFAHADPPAVSGHRGTMAAPSRQGTSRAPIAGNRNASTPSLRGNSSMSRGPVASARPQNTPRMTTPSRNGSTMSPSARGLSSMPPSARFNNSRSAPMSSAPRGSFAPRGSPMAGRSAPMTGGGHSFSGGGHVGGFSGGHAGGGMGGGHAGGGFGGGGGHGGGGGGHR